MQSDHRTWNKMKKQFNKIEKKKFFFGLYISVIVLGMTGIDFNGNS